GIRIEEARSEIEKLRAAIQQFDFATCTTPRLKIALENLGVSQVEIVPNTPSAEVMAMSIAAVASNSQKKDKKKTIIGYPSGSATHQRDLAIAIPALIRILEEFQEVELHLCGFVDLPEALASYQHRIVKKPFVNNLLLPEILAGFDISIAPLESSNFCNAKSEIKYLEAGLVKVPTVASVTEPFQAVIEHGTNGFLVENDQEWYECLKQLVADAELRQKMGQASFEKVMEEYSPAVRVSRSVQAFVRWIQDKNKGKNLRLTNDWRSFVQENFDGQGIEIGALDKPFQTNFSTQIKYVDIMTTEELKKQYRDDPSVSVEDIVRVDHISSGQNLSMFTGESVDFVCSCHLLEHLPNPGKAIQEWLRVVKKGGNIFFLLPDKRYCFDRVRKTTPLSHLIDDFEKNVDQIEYAHYEDHISNLHENNDSAKVRAAFERQGSVHVHTYTYDSFVSFLDWLQEKLGNFQIVDTKQLGADRMHIAAVLQKT
ncbi:MAG: glycosyltransferase, partial [Deltaproteobacteria bacterium]|nr:glycosyltransferase [Deltaproteobacteria bacterium]